MEYRMGTQTDIEALTEMRLAFIEDCLGRISEEEISKLQMQLALYYKKHLNKDLFVYVAEEQKRVVSTAYLLVQEKPANLHFITGKTGEVLSVYTRPEYRRKGIAKTVLCRLLADAKKLALSYLELNATKQGAPLYRQLGFTEYASDDTEMRYEIGGKI